MLVSRSIDLAKLIARAGLALLVVAVVAQAQDTEYFFERETDRGWYIAGVSDPDQYCAIVRSGTASGDWMYVLHYNSDGQIDLGIENDGWNLTDESRVAEFVFYRSNGSVYDRLNANMEQVDSTTMRATDVDFDLIGRALFYASRMSVVVRGLPTVNFSLIGSAEAMEIWAQCVESAPQTSAANQPDPEDNGVPSVQRGTGTLINGNGAVLTAAHVVAGCTNVSVGAWGESTDIRRDEANDLALIIMDDVPDDVTPISLAESELRLGDSILVFGFPFSQILSESLNVTQGIVSSVAGPQNDSRVVQISATVNPGNSGGPVLNDQGLLVGVVLSVLDDLAILENFGVIPEGVAFAIRHEVAHLFLSSHDVEPAMAVEDKITPTTTEIAEAVSDAVVTVACSPENE